ncbi:MAG TPA: sulfotransferase domain-containing protein [Gaiellaceae bacterium]|jgi:hypothetical protein
MNRPSFFIAGNSKSGTTALFRFLDAHPAVFMSRPKEPNYFASDFCHDPNPSGSFHPITEIEYLALFETARPDQLCGEASACYLYSQAAAAAIREFAPDARIVVILREPVEFLASYHLQLLQNPVTEGETERDLATALALEPERRLGDVPNGCLIPELLYYRERVRYAHHLERLYESFDKSQVLVLIYEEYERDNRSAYRDVIEFLDLDPDFEPDFERHNEGAKLRSRRLQSAFQKMTHGETWGASVKAVARTTLPRPIRSRLQQAVLERVVFEPKPSFDPEFAAALRAEFAPEVERCGSLIGRDLIGLWGYRAP